MKAVNLPSGAQRNVEVGLVWVETAQTTFQVQQQGTIRVDTDVGGLGDVTVTIGGVLAMTMRAGQVELFNVGTGAAGDGKTSVTVVIGGAGVATARVQIAKEIETGRRTK